MLEAMLRKPTMPKPKQKRKKRGERGHSNSDWAMPVSQPRCRPIQRHKHRSRLPAIMSEGADVLLEKKLKLCTTTGVTEANATGPADSAGSSVQVMLTSEDVTSRLSGPWATRPLQSIRHNPP